MPVFWLVLLAAALCGVAAGDDARIARTLRRAAGAALLLAVTAHVIRFGSDSLQGMPAILNAALMLAAAALLPPRYRIDRHASDPSLASTQ